jgi:hypothetical protein
MYSLRRELKGQWRAKEERKDESEKNRERRVLEREVESNKLGSRSAVGENQRGSQDSATRSSK